jgi:hypothetical protein
MLLIWETLTMGIYCCMPRSLPCGLFCSMAYERSHSMSHKADKLVMATIQYDYKQTNKQGRQMLSNSWIHVTIF